MMHSEDKISALELDENDVYKDLLLHPEVTSWLEQETGETHHGIQVMNIRLSTDCKRYAVDLCPICLKPCTLDKIHQTCCLPCGHMFGMSCLKEWMHEPSSDKVCMSSTLTPRINSSTQSYQNSDSPVSDNCFWCPECGKNFSSESVRLLDAANPRLSHRRFPFNKIGFTSFKKYELILRTYALNNRSDALKQRADVLGRQNEAMKRQAELLNRMAYTQKRADVLEPQNEAMKRQTQLLYRMSDEEERAEASEQQADAEKRAEALRRRADALGQRAGEYLRKAEVFGQQAEALRRRAKSLRQLADSYLESRKFFIQSYLEFSGLHDKKTTQ